MIVEIYADNKKHICKDFKQLENGIVEYGADIKQMKFCTKDSVLTVEPSIQVVSRKMKKSSVIIDEKRKQLERALLPEEARKAYGYDNGGKLSGIITR